MKVVAGSDGGNASKLAYRIHQLGRVPTIDEAYELARFVGFGSEQTLVVISRDGVKYEGDGKLSTRYRKTFEDPSFNPRWKHGISDFTEVIDLD